MTETRTGAGMTVSRTFLYWSAAGVIVSAVGVVAAIALPINKSPDGDTQNQAGSNNQQANNGGIAVGGDLTIAPEAFKARVENLSREEALKIAKKYADVPPKSGEPAPYVVVDAPRHLWVRSSGDTAGHHIGAASNSTIIWAECSSRTGFDPDPRDDTGDEWLRIRWPTTEPNEKLMNSQTSDQYVGWVYMHYVIPAGHDGAIPQCQ